VPAASALSATPEHADNEVGAVSQTASHPRPILVVDDDPVARALINEYLAVTGLLNPRLELPDGVQAIAEMQRRADLGADHLPALVLLDRHMPGCSGLDVLRWMRRTPALADVPVVLLSGDSAAAAVTQAYQLGARSYLVKPVGFEALGAVVRDLGLPWLLV
jgi:CheY-like chemotaxis protein